MPDIRRRLRGVDRDTRAICLRAMGYGWTVRVTKRGHVMVYSPQGDRVTTSGTASDKRAVKNFLSSLRRAGLPRED